MLTVSDLNLQFGNRVLFDEVNLKFTRGNCYGVIGANGAGKSTFLKIISNEVDPTRGSVTLDEGNRMAVLRQDHYAHEDKVVLEVVMRGHEELWNTRQEKDAIYDNPNATEEDYMRAADLEAKFGEMDGYNAESDAAELLSLLGVAESFHWQSMSTLNGAQKVKVLLAQALFGNPDILLLDEPTNDLDPESVNWLSNFLADYRNTV
ncbi:MAG: ATP-binding cassette domain-containing protein, partial [Bacteroidota bacterium]